MIFQIILQSKCFHCATLEIVSQVNSYFFNTEQRGIVRGKTKTPKVAEKGSKRKSRGSPKKKATSERPKKNNDEKSNPVRATRRSPRNEEKTNGVQKKGRSPSTKKDLKKVKVKKVKVASPPRNVKVKQ